MTHQSHRVLVLGHSFVARLATFVTTGTLNCLDSRFGFINDISVKLHGIGGRTVDSLRNFDLHMVKSFKPTLEFLEIGSNDLSHPNLPVHILVANIMHLIQILHVVFGVPHIVVTQVLKRHRTKLPYPSYNTRVFQFNYMLLQLTKTVPFASFWFHRMVTHSPSPILLPDGVHLNSEGNHLLYHSYHEALHFYTSRFAFNQTNFHFLVSRRPPWSRQHRHSPY